MCSQWRGICCDSANNQIALRPAAVSAYGLLILESDTYGVL
jgi:hypothetical protein